MIGLTVEQRVGMRVRAARKAARMSQEQLASRIGLVRTSITNLEAGRQGLTISKLAALALVLRIDLADLIREDDLPEPDHKVTIRRVYDIECETCNAVVDGATTREQAVTRRREHIEQARAASVPDPRIPA